MVEVFVCPEVKVPVQSQDRRFVGERQTNDSRKPAGQQGNAVSARSKNKISAFKITPSSMKKVTAAVSTRARENMSKAERREELRGLMSSIKDFNSTTQKGKVEKRYKEDKLTKLGVPPKNQQTWPFPKKMALLAARKKRTAARLEEERISGVVAADGNSVSVKRQRRRR